MAGARKRVAAAWLLDPDGGGERPVHGGTMGYDGGGGRMRQVKGGRVSGLDGRE
jgi:hypothetical protein